MSNRLIFNRFWNYIANLLVIILLFFFFSQSVYANMLLKKKAEWVFSSGEKIKNVEVVNDGTIFIFTDNELNVYDRFGTLYWKFTTSGNNIKEYQIIDNIVYLSTDEILFSLNPDGSERWSFNLVNDEKIKAFEIGLEGDMYIQTTSEFYSLDPVDGQENWHFSNGEKINSYKLLETEGLVYIVTSDSVYALDAFSNA